ncbi:protein tyrosine phosphatase domain-containing protein 1 isoform X2 [Gadus morhua]|uniref:Protein tyrosine phosphatase domain containing 1a n=1 Tax=Gadus morhua TaxID=8049 RepID=A0A8C5C193_GADMO|nr:protein tyrosine phosphatase domain-containing protein 1 isoform X2 [Gadus morhua]
MAAAVGVLSDLPYSPSGVCCGDMDPDMDTANTRVPTAKYTKMGETLRHVIPGHMQCSMACGGKACKYENPSRWSDEEQAVKGLYSSWITDNLLAMARPSTEIIEKYNVIEQFQRCGLKTVINLQRPGEHASCGNSLAPQSGFTYRPEAFMEAGIYFYNFGWKDYGVASLTTILDMVKVMSFAIQEGKMAVHCHAGLGRTGVLLACYLVFTARMTADQAILFVRAKRPNSIQTRGQLLCVREFAAFLAPLRSVFACTAPAGHRAVTLSQYLARQRHLLHGYEARQMKNVPKIVRLACRRLLDLAAADHRAAAALSPPPPPPPPRPDLAAEVEKTVSQQALQQLGKEMRGKGIPMAPPPSPCLLPGLPPPPVRPLTGGGGAVQGPTWNVPAVPPLPGNRRLSYSDSALYQPEPRPHLQRPLLPVDGLIKPFLSHTALAAACDPRPALRCLPPHRDPDSGGSFGSAPPSSASSPAPPLPILPAAQEAEHQWRGASPTPSHPGGGGQSPGVSEEGGGAQGGTTSPPPPLHASLAERAPEAAGVAPGGDSSAGRGGGRGDAVLEVPGQPLVVRLQSDMPMDARRLLVARALAMDLRGRELTRRVSAWQADLNGQEGAWERLFAEQDPVVLSGLMWSWLEQLKEPVISAADVALLMGDGSYNPQRALDSLEKGHRLTLLCILECAAGLLPSPTDLEEAFLNRTIRGFTKMDGELESNRALYKTLKAILRPVLHEMRQRATESRHFS